MKRNLRIPKEFIYRLCDALEGSRSKSAYATDAKILPNSRINHLRTPITDGFLKVSDKTAMGNSDTRGASIYMESPKLRIFENVSRHLLPWVSTEDLFSAQMSAPSLGLLVSKTYYYEPQMTLSMLELNKSSVNSKGERWRLVFARTVAKKRPHLVQCAPQS